MSQGSRPNRVAEQIRNELALLLAREVHDPGIGFVTLTRVQISPDLQSARVFYTALGDGAARGNSARALERASPEARPRAQVPVRRIDRRTGSDRAAPERDPDRRRRPERAGYRQPRLR
jgi:ribosome-binding factor A